MEEEPTVAAPRMEEDVVAAPPARDADDEVVESKPKKVPLEPVAEVPDDDEFDLSDITHNPQEPSREDIIAAAEAAAFADKA